MALTLYDVDHFQPALHRVRLWREGYDRLSEQGPWEIGLDRRPGGPMFLTEMCLTLLFHRLVHDNSSFNREEKAQVSLRVTPVGEDGREGQPFLFVPTKPYDDNRDREAYQAWHSTRR